MLVVSKRCLIGRPPATVRAQFADVAYHQQSGHHHGVRFTVLDETTDSCRYEQVTTAGPIRLRQVFELDRSDPAHQVNALTSGTFAPGSIEFVIDDDGDGSAVTATLTTELRGVARLAGPLLRIVIGRSLRIALDEDRADLESGRYERRPPPP